MRRDCTRVSLIEDRRNEHGRQRRDRHTVRTRTRLAFTVFPRRVLDPLTLSAPRHPSYSHPLFPAYARARGNGKWGFAISLTFEHSSSSRSRPHRNSSLSSPRSPFFSSPSLHTPDCCLLPLPTRVSRRPPPISPVLQISLRVGSSFHTVRSLRMNLTDDGWYEIVTSGRRTADCGLFVLFSSSSFQSLAPSLLILSLSGPLSTPLYPVFYINARFIPCSPSRRPRFWRIQPVLRQHVVFFIFRNRCRGTTERNRWIRALRYVERPVGVWLNLSWVPVICRCESSKGWESRWRRGEGGCVRKWKVVEGGSSDVAISEMAEISFTPRRVI